MDSFSVYDSTIDCSDSSLEVVVEMAEEGKKISFGFAKSIKKPTLVKQIPQEEKKVDYIECLDEKAIKVIG